MAVAKRDPTWAGRRRGALLSAARGPKHNSFPAAKIAIREWLAGQIGAKHRTGYAVYGGGGLAAQEWKRHGLKGLDGPAHGEDALDALGTLQRWDYAVWDVDPFSNPFPAIRMIGQRAAAPLIALFVTDGCLRKMAQIRGRLPSTVLAVTGWLDNRDEQSRWLKARIYHHYPEALAWVLSCCLAPRYKITAMRVVRGRGASSANYAGMIARRCPP